MLYKNIYLATFIILFAYNLFGQTNLEGYAFESGNRGFLPNVNVTLVDKDTGEIEVTLTDVNGKYIFQIDSNHDYEVKLEHDLFEPISIEFSSEDSKEGETMFLSHEMTREPGYIFEITLAEKNKEPDAPKDALNGALIEVYNNTEENVILKIDSLNRPDFRVDLKKGNHYTILVRHRDFLTKRMEAFVDVEGCILCFEGIGDVHPGVSDNLTEKNQQGTLLANIELEKYFDGKIISLSNIYYKYNEFNITSDAATELDKAAVFINDNPNIKVELSSHTDSRGRSDYNEQLSQQRSEAAVRYLLDKGGVNPNQITAQGYGEEQPINECKDGATCTEEEHAANRRTELKLLKIEEVKGLKTLEDLKREERFEKMLKEIEFGGSQIRVESEEELPGENGLAKDEADEADDDGNIEVDKEDMTTEYTEEVTTTGPNPPEGLHDGVVNNDDESFTGFRLVIHFSRFSLPDSNKIFERHEDVIDYVTMDRNHLYMVGDFGSRREATKYLQDVLLKDYPNAYLVAFRVGIRVE